MASSSSTLTSVQQRTSTPANPAPTSKHDASTSTADSGVVMTYAARLVRNREHKKMVNQYEFMHRLGRGQHGEVFVAMDTVSKQEVVRPFSALVPPISTRSLPCARVHRRGRR